MRDMLHEKWVKMLLAFGLIAVVLFTKYVIARVMSPAVPDAAQEQNGGSSAQDKAADGRYYTRFHFNESNIESWRESEGAFIIQLESSAHTQLYVVTGENFGKPIDLYIGKVLVGRVVVYEPIANGRLMFGADGPMKERIRALLPPAKEIVGAE